MTTTQNLGILNTRETEDSMNAEMSQKARNLSRVPAAMPQPPTTRWNPTPEQLMILEEMYRSGIRTPNAEQIQQITAHLGLYGKIEGKNVFYWFQNHKARDRQKLRRKMEIKQDPTSSMFVEHSALDLNRGRNNVHEARDEYYNSLNCGSMEEDYEGEMDSFTMKRSTRPLQTLQLFPTWSGL